MIKIEIKEATKERLDELWKDVRKRDKEELLHFGIDDTNYEITLSAEEAYITYVNDKPLCFNGVLDYGNTVVLAFFATDKFNKYLKQIVMYAKEYIKYIEIKYFGKKLSVHVWSEYLDSQRFIKALGFKWDGKKIAMLPSNQLVLIYDK
ncbi:hypothetical protein V5T82_14205 [Magnetovibrio sp. PR-2]|uniref:hypothetical protein n=1 Tax=Magnetovibrio sp. PR-2 TaxID=3120356 RepID=UPI002FCE39E0